MNRKRLDTTKIPGARFGRLVTRVGGGILILLCVAFVAWLVWPRSDLIEIHTVPSGAEVEVNGTMIGISPVEATVRSRNAHIAASLAGYETATLDYKRGGSDGPLRLFLQPQPAICSIKLSPGNAEVAVRDSNAVITGSGSRRTAVINNPQPGQLLTFIAKLAGHPDEIHQVAVDPGAETALEIRFPALLKLTTQPAFLSLKVTASAPDAQIEPDGSVPRGWVVRVPEPMEDSGLQLQWSVAGLPIHQHSWSPRPGAFVSESIRLPVAVYEVPDGPDGFSVSIRDRGRVVAGPEDSRWLIVHCPEGERTGVLDFLHDGQILESHLFQVESERISAEPTPLPLAVYEINVQPAESKLDIEGAGTLFPVGSGEHLLLVFKPDGKEWLKLRADSERHRSVHQLITPVTGVRDTISIRLPDLIDGFERVLPGDVALFVNVPDYGSFKDRLLQLRGVQMCQDPAMQPFVDEFLSNSQKSANRLKAQSGIDIVRLCAAHTGTICLAVAPKSPAKKAWTGYALSDVPGNHDTIQAMLDQAGRILEKEGFVRQDRGDLQIFTGPERWPTGADQRCFTVTSQDFLVAGTDPDRLQALLSRLAGDAPDDANRNDGPLVGKLKSLAVNPRLARFRKQTDGVGDFEVVADLDALFREFPDRTPLDQNAIADLRGLALYLLELNKLDVAGLSFSIARGECETNLQGFLGTEARPLAFRLFDMPTSTLEPEPWVPADAVGYWSWTWDLDGFESTLAEEFPSYSGLLNLFATPWFGPNGMEPLGNRLTVVLGAVQKVGEVPVPQPLFALQLDDAPEIADALARDKTKIMLESIRLMLESIGGPLQEERRAGRVVYSLPVLNMLLAVTVTDTHLLIGERSLVLQALNPRGAGLAQDPEFRRVAKLFPERTSMIWFYRSTQQFQWLHTVLRSEWVRSLPLPEWPALSSFLDSLNGKKLPPHQQLRQYTLPSGGYLTMDDRGVHAVHFTVTPEDGGPTR